MTTRDAWREYDATELALSVTDKPAHPLLVDQGMADQFLDEQLYPDDFENACAESGIDLTLHRRDGYDHGYYFIASFIDDHLRHHAQWLQA